MTTKAVQRRRGTSAENAIYTGVVAEITIDTDKKIAIVHDGITQGGLALAREDLSKSPIFTGDSGTGGMKGLVPSPAIGDANKFLKGDGTWTEVVAPDTAVSLENIVYVAKNGDDTMGNGTLKSPFHSIQHAIDSSADFSCIFIAPGSYSENLTISGKTLNIRGTDAFMSVLTTVSGSVSISSMASVSLSHMNIFQAGTNPTDYAVYLSDAGSCRFDQLTVTRASLAVPAIRIVGSTSTSQVIFLNSYVEGTIDCASNTQQSVQFFGLNSPLASFSLTGINKVVIADSACIGHISHDNGMLYIRNIGQMVKSNGEAITSTALASAENGLIIRGVDFQQDDLSYGIINKTGSCHYGLTGANRDVLNDILVGTRVGFGSAAEDVSTVYAPTHYTTTSPALSDHLAGIDGALASVASQASVDALSQVAHSGSYTDLTDKPTLFSGAYDDLANRPNLGTASSKNAGFGAGDVPFLDVDGKLNINTIPTIDKTIASLLDVDLTDLVVGSSLVWGPMGKWVVHNSVLPETTIPASGGTFSDVNTDTISGGTFADVPSDKLSGGVF